MQTHKLSFLQGIYRNFDIFPQKCIKASFYSNLGYHWRNFTNIYQVYVFLKSSQYIIQWVYAILVVKIHIVKIHMVKRLMLKHFLRKIILFWYFLQVLKITAYHHPSTIFYKNSNSNNFLTNTINTTAQSTAVFSTIAHLLFHNRCQFFSHFLMVIEQFALFIAQCCLNNWFEVLSTCVTLIQSLVSQLIGTNKKSIKSS